MDMHANKKLVLWRKLLCIQLHLLFYLLKFRRWSACTFSRSNCCSNWMWKI